MSLRDWRSRSMRITGAFAIPSRRLRQPGRPRVAPLAALLGFALIIVGILTYQAQDAARSHRGTAERTLHDYASFAMWELSREATRELLAAMVATFVAMQASVDPDRPADWPSAASLKATVDERPVAAPYLEGVGYYFRLTWADTMLTTAGAEDPTAAEAAWIKRAVVNAPRALDDSTTLRPLLWGSAERGSPRMLNVTFSNDSYVMNFARPDGGAPRVIAFAMSRDLEGRPLVAYGFASDAASVVAPIMTRIVQKSPLLPPSLVQDKPTDSILSVHVHDPAGTEVFATGRPLGPTGYVTKDTLDPRFGGLVFELALRPEIASQLIVGGLPQSRLPLLLGLLGLAAALVAVALLQLRRQEELARLRTDFVSGVSHELRTPLAQIRLFAELLRKRQLPTVEEQVRSAEIIDEEAQRLGYLVENVLSFSRAEHDAQQVAARPVELATEVRSAVEAFAPLARARRATLRAEVEPGLRVRADSLALRQVLFNLFDNAVKYGPPGSTVTAGGAASGDGTARLWVDDEGPGVPPAERERIFAPYYRMQRDSETAVGGSGIGLAVVRELVALHGGRAWVEDAPSGGARVVVELPAERTVATRTESAAPAQPEPSSLTAIGRGA